MAKKDKKAAGAKPGAKRKKPPPKKKRGKKGVAQPRQQAQPKAARSQADNYRDSLNRAAGGVPPTDAFDNIKRRPPPDLPGPNRQPAAGGAAGGAQRPGNAVDLDDARRANGGGKAGPGAKGERGKPAGTKKPPRQKVVNPVRLRRRRRIAAVAAVLAIVAIGAVLSVNLLFKIDKYDLQGESPYELDRLVAAFGHAPGDNMYGFSAGTAAERIATELPYVEALTIRRRLPSTIVFRVTTAEEGYYLLWEDAFAVLSTQMKVLRVTPDEPEGLVRIRGLQGLDIAPGHPLALTEEAAAQSATESSSAASDADDDSSALSDGSEAAGDGSAVTGEGSVAGDGSEQTDGGEGEDGAQDATEADGDAQPAEDTPADTGEEAGATPAERFAALDVMLQALEDIELEDITSINVGDPLNLRFSWQGRITVKLGPRSGMDEKMAAAVVLLCDDEQNLIDPLDSGTLDMTYYIATGRSYFAPD